MAVHDVGGQGVGIVTAEYLLVALVGILHQIGHRLDGVPDGVRGEFQGQRLRGERAAGVGEETLLQTLEAEGFAALAGDVQGQTLCNQDAVGEHGQGAFLAVGKGWGLQIAGHDTAGDGPEVLRHHHTEMHFLRRTGFYIKLDGLG